MVGTSTCDKSGGHERVLPDWTARALDHSFPRLVLFFSALPVWMDGVEWSRILEQARPRCKMAPLALSGAAGAANQQRAN